MIKDNAVVYELWYPHPPGQRFSMSCDPFGQIEAEILEIDPPRRLVMRWAAVFGTTTVRVELAVADDGTALTLVHSGWGDGATPVRDQFDSGWTGKLGVGLLAVLDQ